MTHHYQKLNIRSSFKINLQKKLNLLDTISNYANRNRHPITQSQ
jgi:hypothetical protein